MMRSTKASGAGGEVERFRSEIDIARRREEEEVEVG